MDVILKEDIPNLGKMGDTVRVRDGYARNYLLPRKLVVEANKKNLRALEHQKRVLALRREKALRAAQSLAEKLAALSLRIPAKVGEEGRLFGSVTNMDLERALKEKGFEIERRKIHLEEPIKTAGDYEVPVRLATDLTVLLKVSVVPEGS
ncbi:MAG TPA: 50S ribosomal protein L9 [Candidatus Acidoferrales bacterium]|nr:50S ribosomal protein L9 [Candidatus Acidoferrales bacterium]